MIDERHGEGGRRPVNKYALLVGIEHYEDGSGITPLKYACRDVHAIGSALREHCEFDTVEVLADRDERGNESGILPTRNAILRSLREAATHLREEDLFLFFFAGHGIKKKIDGTDRSFLLAHDAFLQWDGGLVEVAWFKELLNKVECRQRVIFLDCCRDDPEVARGDGDNLRGAGLAREFAEACARSAVQSRVTVIMWACGSGQRAYEWDGEGHGVFSAFLKKGIEGAAWQDGQLETMDLCIYVHKGLTRWSEKYGLAQTPDFQHLETPQKVFLGVRRCVPPPEQYVECPLDGRENLRNETFRCRECGESGLCLGHLDRKARMCSECVTKRDVAAAEKARRGREAAAAERAKRAQEAAAGDEVKRKREEAEALERKKALTAGDLWELPVHGLRFRYVPLGEFLMGSPASEQDRSGDEKQHLVRLSHGLWVGETVVTQGQYRELTGESPSRFSDSDDLPVESVSWYDAVRFANALSARVGVQPCYQLGEGDNPEVRFLGLDIGGFRLATEAEWEYACRAEGQVVDGICGNRTNLADFAWCNGNSGSGVSI